MNTRWHFFWRLPALLPVLMPAWLGAGTLADPGTASNTIVRFEVQRGTATLGRMDVELFDRDKPETVRNFLLYVRSGAYSNSFLHRCLPGFIVQGGGFSVTNPTAATRFFDFQEVTNLGRLTNEFLVGPRLTNLFGKLAMAKIGGDPDSATSQWFFNLGNNSTNLDNQNGGFTVFGRVLESTNLDEGTNLLAHFNMLTTSAGIVNLGSLLGSAHRVFSDLPVSYMNTVFRVPDYNELYYVKLSLLNNTNPPGPALPTVNLLSPLPNARFTNRIVTVRGTADDDTGVARVVYRVQGGSLEIATGTTNWELNFAPQPGFNAVSVESIDCDGNHSSNAPSVTFFYVAQTRLNLQVSGKGSVAGATNGQLLQAGRFQTLTARPAAGQVFQGWSGSLARDTASITFQVPATQTNFSLTARFAPDPFTQLAGVYHGLIRAPSSPALDDTGFLAMALTKRGTFSGSILHRGGRYSYTGRFDRTGSAFVQGTLGGVTRSLSLQLQLTDGAGVVTGSLFGGSGSVEVQLERLAAVLPATNQPPIGRYTFALPGVAANVPRQLTPGGSGFGAGRLVRSGILPISGTLGDGRAFAVTPRISRATRWPLYAPLSGGRGVLLGWLSASANDPRRLDGALQWIASPNARAVRYPTGFTNQITCLGSFYAPPTGGVRVVNWVHGLSRASGANMELPMTNLVKLTPNNTLEVPPANDPALKFSFDLKSGLMSGSFVHPWLGTTNALRGVILQRDHSIRGQFLEGDQSGNLTVSVAPFLVTQSVANVTLAGLTAALNEGGLLRFEQDGVIALTNSLSPRFDTSLDANGHNVVLTGSGATRLFEVPAGVRFFASGITFANGRHLGTNGANGNPARSGGDGCGAGIFNAGGIVALTNCTLTNFVVVGGDAGMEMSLTPSTASGGRAMGAAICSLGGAVTLQGCHLADNVAEGGASVSNTFGGLISTSRGAALGGAVFATGGDCEVRDTAFLRNQARGGETWSSVPSTVQSGEGAGGALALDGGRLRVVSSLFSNNVAQGGGPAFTLAAGGGGHGGALFVETNTEATAEQTIFSGNTAVGGNGPFPNPARARGGAVFNGGTLRLRECTLESNIALGAAGEAGGRGLGGAVASAGALEINASTLNDNRAEGGGPGDEGSGGGLHADGGSVIATNSTFAFNLALGGSAADASGVRGNGRGGALTLVSNSAVLINLTLAYNRAEPGTLGDTNTGSASGGGIASLDAALTLRGSILATNAPANISGGLADGGYNLSSDDSFAFTATASRTNIDALLGPLTTNGGPTRTMSLLANSPARDIIPFGVLPRFDQRGVSRPLGANGDSGAFEAAVILPPPTFVVFPSGGTVRAGVDFVFQSIAQGPGMIGYYWLKDGLPLPGATSSTLFLSHVQATNAGDYAVVATNDFGSVTSIVATLTVDSRPLILIQPSDLSVAPGATTNFAVFAGGPELSFQWLHDGFEIAGATNATLGITNAQPGAQGTYQVVITNFAGAITSRLASLTFNAQALSILVPPQNMTVVEGQGTAFSVLVGGVPPFNYQWFFENDLLAGATNNTLAFASVSRTNAGVYRVVVTNAFLTLASVPALLTVEVPSVLSIAAQGPDVLIQSLGTPRRVQVLLYAPSLAPGETWTAVATNALSDSGTFTWTRPLATNGAAYYRVVSP